MKTQKKRGRPRKTEPAADSVQVPEITLPGNGKDAKAGVSHKIADPNDNFSGFDNLDSGEPTILSSADVKPDITDADASEDAKNAPKEPDDAGKDTLEEPGEKEPDLEIPEKFRGPEGQVELDKLLKSYNEAESKLTALSQQVSSMEDYYRNLLSATQPKQPLPELDDVAEKIFEDPKNALGEFSELVINKVKSELEAEKEREAIKRQEEDKANAIKYLAEQGITLESPDMPFIDTYATRYLNKGDSYTEAYKQAVKDYNTFVASLKERIQPEVAGQVQEVENMKRKARVETASATAGKKMISASYIRDLLINNPQEYARREAEFMKAYQEGRVKND